MLLDESSGIFEKYLKPEKKPMLQDFKMISLLGSGSFGEVYLVQYQSTFYAMKVLPKQKIINNNLTRYALAERNILAQIRHPFIVQLHYAFQTTSSLILMLEYCPASDLTQYINAEKRFSKEKA